MSFLIIFYIMYEMLIKYVQNIYGIMSPSLLYTSVSTIKLNVRDCIISSFNNIFSKRFKSILKIDGSKRLRISQFHYKNIFICLMQNGESPIFIYLGDVVERTKNKIQSVQILQKRSIMEKACAVQIVKLKNHKFNLDLEPLKKILQNPKIKDRKVVVVSVAGAFRKGKSFLLAFFLRFLYACVSTKYIFNINYD